MYLNDLSSILMIYHVSERFIMQLPMIKRKVNNNGLYLYGYCNYSSHQHFIIFLQYMLITFFLHSAYSLYLLFLYNCKLINYIVIFITMFAKCFNDLCQVFDSVDNVSYVNHIIIHNFFERVLLEAELIFHGMHKKIDVR